VELFRLRGVVKLLVERADFGARFRCVGLVKHRCKGTADWSKAGKSSYL